MEAFENTNLKIRKLTTAGVLVLIILLCMHLLRQKRKECFVLKVISCLLIAYAIEMVQVFMPANLQYFLGSTQGLFRVFAAWAYAS